MMKLTSVSFYSRYCLHLTGLQTSEVLDKIDCIIFINLILSDGSNMEMYKLLSFMHYLKFPWWSTGFLPGHVFNAWSGN